MTEEENNKQLAAYINHYAFWCAESQKAQHAHGFNARITDKNRRKWLQLRIDWSYAESGRYLYLFLLARDHDVYPVGSTLDQLDVDRDDWDDMCLNFRKRYRELTGEEAGYRWAT